MNIEDLKIKRKAYAAEMAALVAKENALPDGEVLDEADAAEFEVTAKKIDALEARIKRAEAAARADIVAAAEKAATVDAFDADEEDFAPRTAMKAMTSTIYASDPAEKIEKGLQAARFVIGAAIARKSGPRAAAQFVSQTWRDETVAKALSQTGGSSVGGVLIPVKFQPDLIELLRARVAVRASNPMSIDMPEGNLTLPRLAGAATAGWGTEVASISTSNPTFNSVVLSAKKLTAMVAISNDLIRRSPVSADTVVRDDLIEVVARTEDLAFLRGPGTGNAPTGLSVQSGISTLTAAGVTLANVIAFLNGMVLKLQNANSRMLRPGWIMNPHVKAFIASQRDGVGSFVFKQELDAGTLLGFPVRTTTAIPNNLTSAGGTAGSEVYLADFADVIVADAMQLSIEASSEAVVDGTSLFQTDQMAIRAIKEVDIALRHPESVCLGLCDSYKLY
ncbi:phage major capsid protein [Roseicella sp. DB1501]|uniref:phage major capsid protein n=1 Tax=Roseicella sp. DB1501 TaxID=2730925 RepID=UPI0014925C7A|nr:phage major capsid protein [Roseicella sp. DB1501]NOG69804.1 phage major capsid protein [Roseicella sp. DB1501]